MVFIWRWSACCAGQSASCTPKTDAICRSACVRHCQPYLDSVGHQTHGHCSRNHPGSAVSRHCRSWRNLRRYWRLAPFSPRWCGITECAIPHLEALFAQNKPIQNSAMLAGAILLIFLFSGENGMLSSTSSSSQRLPSLAWRTNVDICADIATAFHTDTGGPHGIARLPANAGRFGNPLAGRTGARGIVGQQRIGTGGRFAHQLGMDVPLLLPRELTEWSRFSWR